MKPSVTILIATYARTAMLAESLYSALNQTYDGALNIVVMNACPLHALTCDAPGVTIINAPHLSKSPLGLIRDELMQAATGELVCMWDDDDIYLPTHVAGLVAKLREGEPAARLRHMLTWNDRHFTHRGGSTNAAHTIIFRRARYGLWPVRWSRDEDSGRADNDFWMRCAQAGWFRGRHHHESDAQLTTVIRMDPDRIRASMCEIGVMTAEQIRGCWDARFADGCETKGTVSIVPAWSRNWTVAVQEFIDGGMVSP